MIRFACMLAVVVLGAAPAWAGGAATVMSVDGRTWVGELTALGAGGATMLVDGKTVEAAAADLQEIRFADAAEPMDRPGRTLVRTLRGGVLPVDEVAVADGRLKGRCELLGRFDLDVAVAASLARPARRTTPRELAATVASLGVDALAGDVLVIRSGPKQLTPVGGVLLTVGPKKIAFRYGGEDRTIDTAKVAWIRLAAVGAAPAPARGVLVGVDGTRLPFDAAALKGGKVVLRGSPAGRAVVDVAKVASLRFHSDRATDLADLEPLAARQVGVFGSAFTLRKNRSAANTPLRLDGRTYSRGLGLHSRCELRYDLAGRYETFVAVAGVDDAARPRGSAVLSFKADGKPLGEPLTLRGAPADQPLARPLRLDVRGVKTLTILLDYGDDLDVGDHIDLAEARLIRK